MAKNNTFVFRALHIVAWIIFAGLGIEAGGLLVNFICTMFTPDFVPHLYQKLDLTQMYQQNPWVFWGVYSFILFIAVLKAYLFYLVVRLMHKMDLSKPFSSFVGEQIMKISYFTFSIGIIGFIARETTRNLPHYGPLPASVGEFWTDSQAFILMGAVIYVIAVIFKKGVDLQNEADLTV